MNIWRSTLLGTLVKHCAGAVGHARRNTPYNRDVFAAGVAAHAILQGLAEQPDADPDAVAALACTDLIANGRSFDGTPEPPLAPAAVFAGRDLAIAWHARHPTPEGARAEVGYAIDAKGRPVGYRDPSRRVVAILDLVYEATEEIDGEPAEGICHLDYKSAWTTDTEDLDGLQMRIQTVMLYTRAGDDLAFIRQQIANLRTGQIHERTIWLDDAGRTMIESWTRDLLILCDAADQLDDTARPGAGCPDCPWLASCAPARAILGDDAADLPTRYAVLDAERARVRAVVAGMARNGALTVPGGVLSYVAVERREPIPDAAQRLAERWHAPADLEAWRAEHALWLALLAAVPLGVTALEEAARRMFPKVKGGAHKAEREAMIEALTQPIVKTELQIIRKDAPC